MVSWNCNNHNSKKVKGRIKVIIILENTKMKALLILSPTLVLSQIKPHLFHTQVLNIPSLLSYLEGHLLQPDTYTN